MWKINSCDVYLWFGFYVNVLCSGSWSKFCNRSNMLNEEYFVVSNVYGLMVNSEFIKGKWCIFIDMIDIL